MGGSAAADAHRIRVPRLARTDSRTVASGLSPGPTEIDRPSTDAHTGKTSVCPGNAS